MAGLLDSLLGSSIDDPKTMGLLQLAASLSSGQKFMPALSEGLLGRAQIMSSAERQKAAQQMQQMQLQRAEREMAQQQAQDQFRASIPSPQMQAAQGALAGGGGPTMANAQNMRQVDPMAQMMHGAMQAGVVDPMQYLASLQPKQAKIKDYKEIRMPDGSVQVVGFDEYGKPVDTGRTPFKAEEVRDFGGHLGGVDPITGKVRKIGDKSQSPDSKASNALGWANFGLSGERLKMDRESAGGLTYEKDAAGNIVALPKRPTMAGPIQAIPVKGMTVPGQKDAGDALALIDQARQLIPKATSSAIGAGVDMGLGAFGMSTQSADNASKLKALEGALVAKMPKMSGPQSDKDVAMYRQMAGEIGNPMTPASRRLAALDTIEEIQRRYSGAPSPAAPASSGLKFLGFEGQ